MQHGKSASVLMDVGEYEKLIIYESELRLSRY